MEAAEIVERMANAVATHNDACGELTGIVRELRAIGLPEVAVREYCGMLQRCIDEQRQGLGMLAHALLDAGQGLPAQMVHDLMWSEDNG